MPPTTTPLRALTRRTLPTIRPTTSVRRIQYDSPAGQWLFGVPPGEKAPKEGWENLFYYGFCGSLVLAGVAYAYKPDTSIQAWALEEARRRLETEGIVPDSTIPVPITDLQRVSESRGHTKK